jgi:hypothetical protein
MDKKRIILPKKKFFGAIDEDLSLKINLDESKNLLREGDRTVILDMSVLFAKERNESPNYKIHGKLRMVFRNMYSGESGYSPVQEKLYLIGDGTDSNDFNGFVSYEEFAFQRQDVKREYNTIPSTSTPGTYSPNLSVVGQSSHKSITPIQAPYHNWNVYLSYVYSGDTQYRMKYSLSGGTSGDTYSFMAGDGIPFRVTDNGSSYKLTCPVTHGISVGEYIVISGGTLNNSIPLSGRTFSVISVGDSTYDSENYVLDVSKSEIPSGTTLSNVIIGKRCIDRFKLNETISTYYVHKHKTLTEDVDCIIDKIGFESQIWEEERKIILENSIGTNDMLVVRNRMESLIYDFKNPFVLTGLTNNLGYLPTDVYVTNVFVNKNGLFDYPHKVGFKFNFHNSWIDEHFSGNTSVETTLPAQTFTANSVTFTGGTSLPIGTVLTGAFIEYNRSELKERVISESYHKMTHRTSIFDHGQESTSTYSGASANNKVGLYYQPHHRVKLRQLSPYVESSNTSQIYGLPQNAKYFEDELLWKWHDVYDHGFIDPEGFGTNYPFINNIHYVKNDINFYLRNEQQYTNKNDRIKKVVKIIC